MSRNVKEILHRKLSHEIQTNKATENTQKQNELKNIPKNIFTRLKYQIQTYQIFFLFYGNTSEIRRRIYLW